MESRPFGMRRQDTCRSGCEGDRALVGGATVEEVKLPCRLAEVARRNVRMARGQGDFLVVEETGIALGKPVVSNVKNTELDLGLWTLASGRRMWRGVTIPRSKSASSLR